ncbi:MAG: chlorohydrolase [Methanoregula sp. PtaU1.Bin051]|nr:MAG: chlorohydrolase [Methanoregula sp. PtaU1.Bin051]
MRDKNHQIISGKALIGDDLSPLQVEIIIEQGVITAIDESNKAPDVWICPAFFNAHTHLGDTVAMDCAISGNLESLVTPPKGLKHRILATISQEDLVKGIRKSAQIMINRGCAGCADFREGGIPGVNAFRRAVKNLQFHPLIFGRDGGERAGDGLGISSVRDVSDIERVVNDAKKAGTRIAFHAGEKDDRDVDTALSYDPDFIIHATHATDAQLKRCADNDIPIVVCPQSNWILSVTSSRVNPPIRRMLDLGCRLFLGTDNAMFVQPDMFAEMAFLHAVYKIDAEDVLQSAVSGSYLLQESFFIKKGAQANFFILDPSRSNLIFSKNPIASIVKRGTSISSCKNVFNS